MAGCGLYPGGRGHLRAQPDAGADAGQRNVHPGCHFVRRDRLYSGVRGVFPDGYDRQRPGTAHLHDRRSQLW